MNARTRHRVRSQVSVRGATGRAGPRRGWRLLWLVLLLVFVPQMPGFGCTAQRRYEVLSFFFDGVPDPNAPAVAATEVDAQGNPVIRAVSFAHQPFEEGKCDACHTITGGFSDFDKIDDSVCMTCHPAVPTAYPRMHGPVALGQCSLCHLPHESSVRPLLRDQPAALCTTCHVREFLPREPRDHFTDRSCLDCHVGHGGTSQGLLHSGSSPVNAPAVAPPVEDSTPRPAEVETEP
jgi:predicted CXXCH cytochrome family protein